MTVAELIERLKALPQEAEVYVKKPLDGEMYVSESAEAVRFDKIGPLLCVEVI